MLGKLPEAKHGATGKPDRTGNRRASLGILLLSKGFLYKKSKSLSRNRFVVSLGPKPKEPERKAEVGVRAKVNPLWVDPIQN